MKFNKQIKHNKIRVLVLTFLLLNVFSMTLKYKQPVTRRV